MLLLRAQLQLYIDGIDVECSSWLMLPAECYSNNVSSVRFVAGLAEHICRVTKHCGLFSFLE